VITALLSAVVAILHGWRIYEQWTWVGLVIAAPLAIWGYPLARGRNETSVPNKIPYNTEQRYANFKFAPNIDYVDRPWNRSEAFGLSLVN
jgi:hypothetical protein